MPGSNLFVSLILIKYKRHKRNAQSPKKYTCRFESLWENLTVYNKSPWDIDIGNLFLLPIKKIVYFVAFFFVSSILFFLEFE